MSMFSIIKQTGSEQIKFCVEKKSNFKAIIAINSTALGPALGDITFVPDSSNYKDSASCACFLSQKLSSVYSFLGLHFGGGKIIAQGKPTPGYEEVYFRSLARHVNKLNGRFIIRSSSYVNKKLLDYIKIETKHILSQSVAVNDEKVLNNIKELSFIGTLREISTKLFENREINKLKIGFFGTADDFKRLKWFLDKYSSVKTFTDPSSLSHEENNFDILLISATNDNSNLFSDLFKINFKSAVGVCEEEIDIEIYEDVMHSKGIFYVPGYLVENLECYYFCLDNIEQINVKEPNYGPFEVFIREKLAYLFDESFKRKTKITQILTEFAAQRIDMLQLMK